MSRFDIAIAVVLRHEGYAVDDPRDPGGATNYGISLRWLKTRNKLEGDIDKDGQIDSEDIKKMQRSDAIRLYWHYWWQPYGYDRIQCQAIATKAFDLAVNMGAKQSHRCLQRAIRAVKSDTGILEDGYIGPLTLAVVNTLADAPLLAAYRSEAAGYYRSLHKPHYEKGWLNRAYA